MRWLRSLFAWKTTYENHAWWRMQNSVTGETRWVRKPGGGHFPIPLVDDRGQEIPPTRPPRPTR